MDNAAVAKTSQMGVYVEYSVRAGQDYRAKMIWSGDSLVKAIFEFSKARTSGKYVYVVLESHSE